MAFLQELVTVQGKSLVNGSVAYASQRAWIQNATVRALWCLLPGVVVVVVVCVVCVVVVGGGVVIVVVVVAVVVAVVVVVGVGRWCCWCCRCYCCS